MKEAQNFKKALIFFSINYIKTFWKEAQNSQYCLHVHQCRGHVFDPWVMGQEDPTCLGAMKPVRQSLGAAILKPKCPRAHALQQESPLQ